MHGPFMEELGSKEMHMIMMELPRMLEHTLHRCMEIKRVTKRKKSLRAPKEEA